MLAKVYPSLNFVEVKYRMCLYISVTLSFASLYRQCFP